MPIKWMGQLKFSSLHCSIFLVNLFWLITIECFYIIVFTVINLIVIHYQLQLISNKRLPGTTRYSWSLAWIYLSWIWLIYTKIKILAVHKKFSNLSKHNFKDLNWKKFYWICRSIFIDHCKWNCWEGKAMKDKVFQNLA